jgi:hypothetical protein
MSKSAVLVRVSIMLLTLVLTHSAHAGARWGCWYEPTDLTIRCELIRSPESQLQARASEVARTMDRRLPPLVGRIWGSPETLDEHRVQIPLMNVPYEMSFVAELAESVMCGPRLECSVLFDANPDGRALERVAAIKDGADETHVMAGASTSSALEATAFANADEQGQRRSARRRRA